MTSFPGIGSSDSSGTAAAVVAVPETPLSSVKDTVTLMAASSTLDFNSIEAETYVSQTVVAGWTRPVTNRLQQCAVARGEVDLVDRKRAIVGGRRDRNSREVMVRPVEPPADAER